MVVGGAWTHSAHCHGAGSFGVRQFLCAMPSRDRGVHRGASYAQAKPVSRKVTMAKASESALL
jgi:hypothetical protein